MKELLNFQRRFTENLPDQNPVEAVKWEKRTARIEGSKGQVVFEQKDVEAPTAWSDLAVNIAASKYFRGHIGSPDRETSIDQLCRRVVNTIASQAFSQGYISEIEPFRDELYYLMVTQRAAFNSPVWFNVGAHEKPQCSACFINAVEDSMPSILDLAKTEGMLFKYGSGTGTNLSVLRSSKEKLAGGGRASGPVSFMRGFDAFAGVIKSGGTTRRAAKMVILNADHPDILEFIRCKAIEEKKAHALIEAGYDSAFNSPGGAYESIQFQNANNSVRVDDAFMEVVKSGKSWDTKEVKSGKPSQSYDARDLFHAMAQAAWECGDPGIQYDTVINKWHTCPNTARINGSNPCSEYMFLDDSACNLASINLMMYRRKDGSFDIASFRHTVQIMITAMEVLVGFSSYPTEKIAANSLAYRPLGLGYANLGTFLMSNGLAYDSKEGRDIAASITALMTGEAYAQSAELARVKGPFEGYEKNKAAMTNVLAMHESAAAKVGFGLDIALAAGDAWRRARVGNEKHGVRNAQASVLAPTGTIGLMMDCDTNGIEPDWALVKTKMLVGGGSLKIVNRAISEALLNLGYNGTQVTALLEHLREKETLEGCTTLREEHLAIFDCAVKPTNGTRAISWEGHLMMMAAVQPFLSGAISKTVNMPNDATVEDVAKAYMLGWNLGLKAVAIYRDGCKLSQPLSSKKAEKSEKAAAVLPIEHRTRLPDERAAVTHKFSIAGHEGYLTVGMYENGQPGELFVKMAKEGSTISGLMDTVGTLASIALQYGVPLQVISEKLAWSRFEPAGFTKNPKLRSATSIVDYVARWLQQRFVDAPAPLPPVEVEKVVEAPKKGSQSDAPPCHSCGSIMVRSGTCYKCTTCGSTSGCS